MNAHRRLTLLASGLAFTGLMAAGCGSRPAASTAQAAPAALPPLATSFAAAAGTYWAVVQMGGSAAQEENFWQLFVLPAGAAKWRQATPLGVADNGGLVVAGSGGGSLLTGFRPSQDLTFSPLAASSDSGARWAPAGPVNPGLADVPDALTTGPGGRVIALTKGGGAELGTGLGAAWTHLSSAKALAATPAGRACGVTSLTAAAFSRSGAPMLAAGCDRPGVSGIFTDSGGWHAAGPALPASLLREDIEVLRLTASGNGVVALLRAGSGPDASLLAAWSGGGPWTLSAPLRVGAAALRSTAFGPGGSIGITLNAHQGETLSGPGASWRVLPALPRWAATLTLGPGGQTDAITAHLSAVSVWRLATPALGWTLAQTIHVTIPYGSSS